MKTAQELAEAFDLYFKEIERCRAADCWWALVHMLVALPDICAALDGKPGGAPRYGDWCRENFPGNSKMTPGDRYQLRCALLHEGTTLPAQGTGLPTQYTSFSLIDPRGTEPEMHLVINVDPQRQGQNCTVNIHDLDLETRIAMQNWFTRVEGDHARNAVVEQRLPKLARVKEKEILYELREGASVRVATATVSTTASST